MLYPDFCNQEEVRLKRSFNHLHLFFIKEGL